MPSLAPFWSSAIVQSVNVHQCDPGATVSKMRTEVESTREYAAIRRWYADRTAARSGIPLVRHIDEGLLILERIEASLGCGRVRRSRSSGAEDR
jgi:hypothetical protein